MLDWLYNTVYTLFGRVSGAVKDLIHSVVSGILGALNAVAGVMWAAWWDLVWASQVAIQAIEWFTGNVMALLWWLTTQAVPDLIKRLENLGKQALAWVEQIWSQAWSLVQDLRELAWGWVQDAIRWVNQNIWQPLYGWVQDLYQKMTDWAYTAWFYVTHPDALAEVIFWSLWGVFARNAFPVAKYVGEWLLRTVMQNAVSSIKLVESILTDVL